MKRKHIIILIVSLVVLAGAGAGIWYWRKKKKEKLDKGDPTIADTLETVLNPEQQKMRMVQDKAEAEKKKLNQAEYLAKSSLGGQANLKIRAGLSKLRTPTRPINPRIFERITNKAGSTLTAGQNFLKRRI
jgi:uncharacterized protein HemX